MAERIPGLLGLLQQGFQNTAGGAAVGNPLLAQGVRQRTDQPTVLGQYLLGILGADPTYSVMDTNAGILRNAHDYGNLSGILSAGMPAVRIPTLGGILSPNRVSGALIPDMQQMMKQRQLTDFYASGSGASLRGEARIPPPGPPEIQEAWLHGWDAKGLAARGGGITIDQGSAVVPSRAKWAIVGEDGKKMETGFKTRAEAMEFANAEVGVPYHIRLAGERGKPNTTDLIDPFAGTYRIE